MSRERVLVVDDEEGVRATLGGVLRDEGYVVDAAESGERGLEMARRHPYHAVLLDVWLPGRDGLAVLEDLAALPSPPRVVMISGHADVPVAHKAGKLGAYDFIEKPLSLDKVVLTLRNAIADRRKEARLNALRDRVQEEEKFLGESPVIRELQAQIDLAAPTQGRVLITGENGTGKELVARLIHARSLRRDELFVEMNCAAIPEELIESELFGHVKGAFTGATEGKAGRFLLADGGTLFLDEIGDMSLRTQAKVLRVLQEQAFEPVGGTTVRVDVRVLAATNKDLPREIAAGRFREDLYFRLNVVPLRVPALRERSGDILILARHFVALVGRQYGRSVVLEEGAIAPLVDYPWPGNVRELRNLIERLIILTPGAAITAAAVASALGPQAAARPAEPEERDFGSLREGREDFERRFIARKLREAAGNVLRAAQLLGLERSHLYRKMRSYGMRTGPGEEEG
ncbi:MAG TPA: sigma-54 dependent transcriptional regulator [Verrucomicrobiae bacterium]|nr:sigma-54 dependent transcriptional regulator [Verrucomicrobiae bacterium]